jgi:purine nucleosidase
VVRKVILDMDPGTDDALALLLALSSPELELLGVTTVAGNTSLENTSINARRVLEHVGRGEVPVYRGASGPLARTLVTAEHVHGSDGLGGVELSAPREAPREGAVEFIAGKVYEDPGEVMLIATGPLTNLALLFARYPDIPRLLGGLIIMGGAYFQTHYGRGNVTPIAEFNIYNDPEAAQMVINPAVRPHCVGLDVTMNPAGWLGSSEVEKLSRSGSVKARLAARLVQYHVERAGHMEVHDVVAVAAAVDSSMLEWKEMMVEVLTCGDVARGVTAPRRPRPAEAPNAVVCVDADWEWFKGMLLERLTG